MPVSSYAVRCNDSARPGVLARLGALPGVTVGEETEQGIPVVTESETSRAARELGEQLEQIPGVESAVLVYHNFEDEP